VFAALIVFVVLATVLPMQDLAADAPGGVYTAYATLAVLCLAGGWIHQHYARRDEDD